MVRTMNRPWHRYILLALASLLLVGCEVFGSDDEDEAVCRQDTITAFGFRHVASGEAELCTASNATLTVENVSGKDLWGVIIEMPDATDNINLFFEPIDIPVNTEVTMTLAGELDGLGRVLGGLRQTTDAGGETLLAADFSGLADRIVDETVTVRYYLQGDVQFETQVPLKAWVPLATYRDAAGKTLLGTSTSWHWVCSGTGDNRTCSLMSDSGPSEYETQKRPGKAGGVVADLIEARVHVVDRPVDVSQVEISATRGVPAFTITGEDLGPFSFKR